MNAGATRNGRSPRDSAEVYAFWRAAALILLFNVLLVAWMLLKPGGDRVAAVVLNAAGFVGPLLVLPLCFGGLLRPMWRREASRTDNEPTVITGQRWAPILLGMGIICWIFAQMLFTYYDLVLHQAPPFPSLADVGYLSLYPFFLLGILLLPARPVPIASRTRLALDGLMIMTAAVTFSWYFILGPVVQQGTETTLAKGVSIAYPLADIVLIACLAILALRPGERALRRAVYVLALGMGSLVVLDSIYAYRILNETYVTGTMWDFGWPGAYMLIALGAFAVQLAPPAEASPDETLSARQGVWRSLLPYALVPAVGVLLFYAWRHSAESGSLAAGVYLGGVLLVGLVLLRQVFLVLFVAVGVGATTAVVVGWQFGRVVSDSAKISTLEGSKSETTSPARALEDMAIESSREAVSDIGSGAGSAVEVVGEGAGGTVEHVGGGVGEVAAEAPQSAGQAAEQVGEGAGQATKQAGEATQEAGQAARAVGDSTGQAAQGVGEAAGQAGDATEQTTGGAQEDPGQIVEGNAAPGGAVLSETTDEAGSTVEQTLSESGEVSEKVVAGEASTGVCEQKGEVQVTHAAERRAEELGVDLSQVEGTGSGGCIKEQR